MTKGAGFSPKKCYTTCLYYGTEQTDKICILHSRDDTMRVQLSLFEQEVTFHIENRLSTAEHS